MPSSLLQVSGMGEETRNTAKKEEEYMSTLA